MPITEIGDAWDLSNPDKPVAILDPDNITDVPCGISEMISAIGYPYASHSVICGPELECSSSDYLDEVIKARFKQGTGQVLSVGTKYPATFRIVFANGESRDRTLWFKIKEQ